VEEQPQDMGQDEDSSMVLGWRPGQVKPRDKQQWKRLYNDKKQHKQHWREATVTNKVQEMVSQERGTTAEMGLDGQNTWRMTTLAGVRERQTKWEVRRMVKKTRRQRQRQGPKTR